MQTCMAFLPTVPIATGQRCLVKQSLSGTLTEPIRIVQTRSITHRCAASVAPTSTPQQSPSTGAQEREIYASAPYRRDARGFDDFNPKPKQRPISTTLFQNPFVAFLYERGWRDRFASIGFPGPDVEAKSAREFIGAEATTVLDASCGTGIMTRRLASEYKRVVALDFSATMQPCQ